MILGPGYYMHATEHSCMLAVMDARLGSWLDLKLAQIIQVLATIYGPIYIAICMPT